MHAPLTAFGGRGAGAALFALCYMCSGAQVATTRASSAGTSARVGQAPGGQLSLLSCCLLCAYRSGILRLRRCDAYRLPGEVPKYVCV